MAFGIEARQENYQIEAGEPASYNRGPDRRRGGRIAGLPGLPAQQRSSTKTARRTAPMSMSKRGSRRNSWRRSRCAAKTTRTSAPPSPARSPHATTSPTRSRCAARCPRVSVHRDCNRSSSRPPPPTSSTACRSKWALSRQPRTWRSRWVRNRSTPRSRSTTRWAPCSASAASKPPSMRIASTSTIASCCRKTSTRRRWRR